MKIKQDVKHKNIGKSNWFSKR